MTADFGYTGEVVFALGVRDLDRSVAFYRDLLGFPVDLEARENGWVELRTPTDRARLGLSEVARPDVTGGGTLVLGVRDVDAARARLEARGIRFDGETVEYPGLVRLATFYDPDGHKLMFFTDLARAVG